MPNEHVAATALQQPAGTAAAAAGELQAMQVRSFRVEHGAHFEAVTTEGTAAAAREPM